MAGQTEDPAQDPQREQTPGTTEPDPNATAETPTAAEPTPAAEPVTTEPVMAAEPVAAAEPATAAEPVMAAEPVAAPEPPAPEPPAAVPPATERASAPEPTAAPEPPTVPVSPGPEVSSPATAAEATASSEYPWLRNGGGQHAVPRPYPPTVARVPMAESMATPPETADGPAGEATAPMPADAAATATLPPQGPGAQGAAAAAVAGAAAGAAAGTATGGPGSIAPTGPEQPATRRAQLREPAELPELPPRPGFARHALGFLVGLVVTPIALVLTGAGVGGFRALDPTTDQAFDATNFSLIAVGAALLVAVVMLALWSPAVPLTGGLVWGMGLGVLYLGWPSTVEGWIDQAYSSRPAALDQLVTTLNDGTWLVLGLLVAAAGLAVSVARRMGRRFGEHTTLATHARIEAARAEETRRQAADAEEAARAERARSIT